MFFIFLRVVYLKTFIRIFYTVIVLYLSEIYLFIYFLYYFIYLINYIVYRKEQSKIRGKSRENLFINSSKLSTPRSFSISMT